MSTRGISLGATLQFAIHGTTKVLSESLVSFGGVKSRFVKNILKTGVSSGILKNKISRYTILRLFICQIKVW